MMASRMVLIGSTSAILIQIDKSLKCRYVNLMATTTVYIVPQSTQNTEELSSQVHFHNRKFLSPDLIMAANIVHRPWGGGDDKAFIWKYSALNDNVGNGEIISAFELTGHTDTVTTVGFNFDGTLALTGSYDGTVRVWQVASGELKLVLEGPEDVSIAKYLWAVNVLNLHVLCCHRWSGHNGTLKEMLF